MLKIRPELWYFTQLVPHSQNITFWLEGKISGLAYGVEITYDNCLTIGYLNYKSKCWKKTLKHLNILSANLDANIKWSE